MNLNEELKKLARASKEKIPEDAQKAMTKATEDLIESGIEERAIKVGQTFPDFSLVDAFGNKVSIYELLKKGPLVISFYRGNWCPYCSLELTILKNYLPHFAAKGASLVAISPQTPDNSLNTQQKHELEFLVLSDVENLLAKKLGLAFKLSEMIQKIYKKFGIDLLDSNGNENYELPVPATFVLDKDATVVFAFAKADYTKRAEPDDILEALNKIK